MPKSESDAVAESIAAAASCRYFSSLRLLDELCSRRLLEWSSDEDEDDDDDETEGTLMGDDDADVGECHDKDDDNRESLLVVAMLLVVDFVLLLLNLSTFINVSNEAVVIFL